MNLEPIQVFLEYRNLICSRKYEEAKQYNRFHEKEIRTFLFSRRYKDWLNRLSKEEIDDFLDNCGRCHEEDWNSLSKQVTNVIERTLYGIITQVE